MTAQERQLFLDYWAQARRKGVLRYVVITAISWGTLTAVFLQLILMLLEQGLSVAALKDTFYTREFLVFWGIFLAGGLFYGLTMWFFFNARYRKLQAQKDKPEEAR